MYKARTILLMTVAIVSIGAKEPKPLPAAQPITASDRNVGAKAHPDLLREFGGAYEGSQAQYVTKIGRKIAVQSGLSNTEGDFTITLLNSPVNNAFAVPGGYVYVTRQLLALMNDEAELASVLGHEVGHVAARHAQKRNQRATIGGLGTVLGTIGAQILTGSSEAAKLAQQVLGTGAQAWVLGYSRSQEYQADDLGISYLGKAGYDPLAASDMLASLANQTSLDSRVQGAPERSVPQWASTHPDPASRVTRAAQRAATTAAVGKARNRDSFIAMLDGMMYDDDPKQGIVDGQTFRHPDLKLMFTAPAGYRMVNTPAAVVIAGTGGKAQFSGGAYSGDLSAYIGSVFKAVGGQNATLSYGEVTRLDVNGIKAATASATANSNSGPVIVTVVAYEFGPSTAFHFVSIEPQAGGGNTFGSLFRSVRRLSDAEAASIKPRVVDVVTVRSGDTVDSLARRMAYSSYQSERFRVLNGLGPSDALKPGQKVKLIVMGN